MQSEIHISIEQFFLVSVYLPGVLLCLLLLLHRFRANRALALTFCLQLLLGGVALLKGTSPYFLALLPGIGLSLYAYSTTFFGKKIRFGWYWVPASSVLVLLAFKELYFFAWWDVLASILAAIYYLVLILRLLGKEANARGIDWWGKPGKRLLWFRNFLLLNGMCSVACFILSTYLALWGIAIVLWSNFIWVAYGALSESTFFSPIPLGNKYQKSTLSASQKNAILIKLDKKISEDKFYLEEEVSLGKLATALHTSTHHLSQVINEYKGVSFQKLVARYRINEARQLLRDAETSGFTIETIASKVGYNSKSAFNAAFKKHAGMTPTEFKSKKDVRDYREAPLPVKHSRFLKGKNSNWNSVLSIKRVTTMTFHFIKIYLRNLTKHKRHSIVNLVGLTVGFCASILLFLYLTEEWSYDKQLPESDQIYRVTWHGNKRMATTPHPLAMESVDAFAEISTATTLGAMYGLSLVQQKTKVKNPATNVIREESDFYFADSTFFDVFSMEPLAGDLRALCKPWTLVITEDMAMRYFETVEVIGKELLVDDMPLEIGLVVKGMPKNSHFHFNGLLSYVTVKSLGGDNPWLGWNSFEHYNYLKTTKVTNSKALERALNAWAFTRIAEPKQNIKNAAFVLQPIDQIHLNSQLLWELEANGSQKYIVLAIGILFFILLITVINYVNLSTAQSMERAKEIGIRKTLGAQRGVLSFQFLMESILFCFIAFAFAFGMAYWLLEVFNWMVQKQIAPQQMLTFQFIGPLLVYTLAIALIAGIYPAFVLSGFIPSIVLKGNWSTSVGGKKVRHILVVLQFTISAILLVGSMVVLGQLKFMENKSLGFDKDAVVTVMVHYSVETGGIDTEKVDAFKTKLMQIAGVKAASAISNLPDDQLKQIQVKRKDSIATPLDMQYMEVSDNVIPTLGLSLAQGKGFTSTGTNANEEQVFEVILNQTAVLQLNTKEIIGARLTLGTGPQKKEAKVVGVVQDFHYQSLHQQVQPLVLLKNDWGINHLLIKLSGTQFASTLSKIEKQYPFLERELPFDFAFLDQKLDSLYQKESQTLRIFTTFSVLALLLACLGLFGLASAMLHQKVKEVGVRKIMGASFTSIFLRILGYFCQLLGVSLVLGIPVGYWLMEYWLQNFSYKMPWNILPFLLAGITLMAVALVSVLFIVIQIARIKPVEALRYE